MKTVQLVLFALFLTTSVGVLAQDDSSLITIRWSSVDKRMMNSGDSYIFVINDQSLVESTDIKKEKLEEGETAAKVHKMLKEYLSKGYELISSNFSTTSNGYCVKGEYLLLKQ